MIRYFLAAHMTSLPQSIGWGMTYFEMSSKLNRVLVAERERF